MSVYGFCDFCFQLSMGILTIVLKTWKALTAALMLLREEKWQFRDVP